MEPLDKPDGARGEWYEVDRICPTCQQVRLWACRLKEGTDGFKLYHYECSKCGHTERK